MRCAAVRDFFAEYRPFGGRCRSAGQQRSRGRAQGKGYAALHASSLYQRFQPDRTAAARSAFTERNGSRRCRISPEAVFIVAVSPSREQASGELSLTCLFFSFVVVVV